MAGNTTTLALPLMVEILEDLRMHHVLECKFEKRMREVQTSMNWNPRGILAPYTTELDYTHFATGESGVIQGGGNLDYKRVKRSMRALWKTVPITGELARLKSEQFVAVKEEFGNEIDDAGVLRALADNRAIEIILQNASSVYGRLKNFYAINGNDASAIGTVTGVPSSTTVEFRWDTTDVGNRFIKKGQKIQFYDTSATTLRRLSGHYTSPRSESEQYSQVTGVVSTSAAANLANNGLVTFDVCPTTALAAGDTAHILQGYGAMPQGFFNWVAASGTLNGESGTFNRSIAPDVFFSTIQDNSSSTANTPKLMIEMESYLAGRMSDNEPSNIEIWMNKAQIIKYQLFGLNSASAALGTVGFNVQRQADFSTPGTPNVGIPGKGLSFNNMMLNEDVDIPPSKNIWIDWLGWIVDEETPTTLYEYHQNQQFYQSQNAYGEPIDAKQVTMFSQYNYGCTKFTTQGYQDDLAFDSAFIAQP